MRKASPSRPAFIIQCSAISPSTIGKLSASKDWRGKLAGAISVGIENYRALPLNKQPPMIVADYRRQMKSAPAEPIAQEGGVKEADASLLELVGRSALLSPQQASTPAKRSSLDSAPIVP